MYLCHHGNSETNLECTEDHDGDSGHGSAFSNPSPVPRDLMF